MDRDPVSDESNNDVLQFKFNESKKSFTQTELTHLVRDLGFSKKKKHNCCFRLLDKHRDNSHYIVQIPI